MDRKIASFIALTITLIFGATVALMEDNRQTIAIAGGMIVALAWLAVATFTQEGAGKD